MLARALGSLCRQTLSAVRYEIIVVDNNSHDDTRLRVEESAREHANVRYLLETKQGLSQARNCGADAARGEYLLYIDDDAIAPSDYLENILAAVETHRPDILGGPVYPYYFVAKPRWFRHEWEIRCYARRSGFVTTGGISGSNYVIRRDLLKILGMFDPLLGMKGDELGLGEDRMVLETYRKSLPSENQRVYYALECPVLHLVPASKMRLGYMLSRHFATGRLNVTVKGQLQTSGAAVKVLLQLPFVVFRKHLDVRRLGWRGIQLVEGIRRAVWESGRVYEAFRQAVLRNTRDLSGRRKLSLKITLDKETERR